MKFEIIGYRALPAERYTFSQRTGNTKLTLPHGYTMSFLMVISPSDNPYLLKECLDSLFKQTDSNFRVFIVLNGNVDNASIQQLKIFETKFHGVVTTIKISSMENLAYALNLGIENIKSDITLRIDPDDICNRNRVHWIRNLFENSNVELLGSQIIEFDSDLNRYYLRSYPTQMSTIQRKMLWNNQFAHSSVSFLTQKIISLGGYPRVNKQEDYALWLKCFREGVVLQNVIDYHTLMNIDNLHRRRSSYESIKTEVAIKKIKQDINSYPFIFIYISFLIRILYRLTPLFIKRGLHTFNRKIIYRENDLLKDFI